jgi:hypothetical protein
MHLVAEGLEFSDTLSKAMKKQKNIEEDDFNYDEPDFSGIEGLDEDDSTELEIQ